VTFFALRGVEVLYRLLRFHIVLCLSNCMESEGQELLKRNRQVLNHQSGAAAPQNKIRVLSTEIIHRIAAGEVIDRPASVLKELLENAIDAGSNSVNVTLVDGGLRLIQVEDNGSGIAKSDLQICMQRHATSKIQSLEDLDQIQSLGFRGEALAAASSVSKLTIESKTAGDSHSWMIVSLGGSPKAEPVPTSKITLGTRVAVEDLFYNVPARLKFLKKPSSELSECVEVFKAVALTHPECSFTFNGIDSSGVLKLNFEFETSDAAQRFISVLSIQNVEVWSAENSFLDKGISSLKIYCLPPPHVSHTQKSVRLSVNGRWVLDKRLPFSCREAFLGLIEIGSFPNIWVDVKVDPAIIDVNIHPQKKEIRWPAHFSLPGIVYKVIRELIAERSRPVPTFSPDSPIQPLAEVMSFFPEAQTVSPEYKIDVSPVSQRAVAVENSAPFAFKDLKVVGEVGAAWLICEAPQGLVIIDQHAAHERVQFDKYIKSQNLIQSSPLAVSWDFEVPVVLRDEILNLKEALESLGFEFSEIGIPKDKLEVIAMPVTQRSVNWKKTLEMIFEEILNHGSASQVIHQLKVWMASSLACHGSVRRGQRLSAEQIRELLVQMSSVAWGSFCPHGRPVWKLISNFELENFFHR
jgi:DNA mismatch repair protein MutL